MDINKAMLDALNEDGEKLRQMTQSDHGPWCAICGLPLTWEHDHRDDMSGLDDGPYLPGKAPRKKPDPKSPEEISDIRKRAWATRRAKYGPHGHR